MLALDGTSRIVAEDVWFPNGMAITADGATLICAESYAHRLTAFDIAADGSLTGRRVWAQLEADCYPDGICLDEDHPTVPEDSYAMSKVANEVTARSFHARTGADIYGLRINNVIEPHEYAEIFPPFLADPSLRRRNLFAYIDVRDLGQMVQRCLETDGLGYEVFNVANADMSVAATTQEIRDRFYDGVDVRRDMGRDETFYAIDKACDLLGFAPRHSWREVLADPGSERAGS